MNEDAKQLTVRWGIPIAIALMAVGVRLLFSTDRLTRLGVARGVLVGIFVGSVVNLYLSDVQGMGEGTKGALVGIAAVLSEDLIFLVMAWGKKLREDPWAAISFIINRGRKE